MYNKPHSIPFITIDSTETKFLINQEALNLLKSSSQEISILSICGEYRTGKSFLLNTLFFSNEGFKVSPTTQPCTKGINLWSRPISVSGKNIWILDTQGFGATNRDQTYDIKMFLLSTLLSTILLYNSFGAIDENTVDKFAAICHEAKNIDSTLDDLKLFWILRDFSLSMQNKDGKTITADQYLEQSLNQLNKQQRNAIKNVFSQRHCIPLVRPVINQNILQKLSQIDFSELRAEFIQQIYILRKKILSQVKQKKIKSLQLTGQNISLILEEYIQLLNRGQIQTNFGLTWQNIIKSQKQRQLNLIQTKLQRYFSDIYKNTPLKGQDIKIMQGELKQFQERLMNQLKAKFSDQTILTDGRQLINSFSQKKVKHLFQFNSEQIMKNQKTFIDLQIQNNCFKQLSSATLQNCKEYLQKGSQIKTSFKKKFQDLDQMWDYRYYLFYSQQQKTIFNMLIQKWIGQFSQQKHYKEQVQRKKKSIQLQFKKYKEQTSKQKKQFQTILKQKQKQNKELRQKLELQKNEELNKVSSNYQQKLEAQKQQNQKNITDLKTTILELEKQFLVLKKQQKLQKSQLQDNIKYQNEKIELLTNKLEQSRIVYEKNIEQLKEQYQNKLKKYDQRNQQTLNQLNHQRKKFLQLNQSKKEQQSQLLEDIAEKNQKVIILRRELASIQLKYKEQLQILLQDQKNSLIIQFTIKIEQFQHKIKIYQQRLQQYLIKIRQLQQYQRQCQTLTIQNRLQKQQHQILGERFNQLLDKVKKNKETQEEMESQIRKSTQKYQKDMSDQNQTMKKLKIQMKQLQVQYENQLKQMQNKFESQKNQTILKLNQENTALLQRKQKQLNSIKQRQIQVLHQNMKRLYSQSQRITHENKNNQKIIQNLRLFLRTIDSTYRQYCNQVKLIESSNESKLLNRSLQKSMRQQSEQQMEVKNVQKADILMQIQYCTQLFKIAFCQLKQLFQERESIKNSLKQTVYELQTCQKVVKQFKQQNSTLQQEISNLNKNKSNLKVSKNQLTLMQQNIQTLAKKNILLQKQVEVRDQIYSKREQSIRENIKLYKQTINNLTQENNQLNSKIVQIQCELNRFTTWQGDINYQITNKLNQEVFTSEIGQKIETLQKINRKLKKQLEDEKQIAKIKGLGVLNNVINQTKINETQNLKKQNAILRKRIQQLRERQIKMNNDVSTMKNTLYQQEQAKLNMLKEEYDNYRKKIKDQMFQLQRQYQIVCQQNAKLKQEMFSLNQKNKQNNITLKSVTPDSQSIKEKNIKQLKTYETAIKNLKTQMSQAKNTSDKQIANLELNFAQKKRKLEEQKQVLKMECQKSVIKYSHLLKVNSELMKQLQNLKNKSAQSVVKEKFKNQIQSLFED